MALVDLAMEKQHLVKADRDIVEGDGRVRRQAELIQHLRRKGIQGVAEAKELLGTLQDTLQTWRDHRENILRAIARLEQEEKTSCSAPEGMAELPKS